MNPAPITQQLAARACAVSLAAAPPAIHTLVRQCVLDYLGVTLAGAAEPAVQLLQEELREEGGNPRAGIVGSRHRMALTQAALVNGMAAHVLDYDDVNFALMGHPSVPILPALLAQAECLNASGSAVMAAFLAGYETECRIGLLMAPGHYTAGFHATATIGAIGAAVACAHLQQATPSQMSQAIGIAATQAAGLKSMFGTACKPLHAGLAARNGLLAARLALRGFDSRLDVLECAQGFAETHSTDFDVDAALAEPAGGFHLFANLFKYHASCYETHATIECARWLRDEHQIAAHQIIAVDVTVHPYCDRICNISEPTSGLEAKFSLRLTAAMTLAGLETADPATFNDAMTAMPELIALRDRISVSFSAQVAQGCAELRIILRDNDAVINTRYNAALPARDLGAQQNRLRTKFLRMACPVLGEPRATVLASTVEALAEQRTLAELVALCAPPETPAGGVKTLAHTLEKSL